MAKRLLFIGFIMLAAGAASFVLDDNAAAQGDINSTDKQGQKTSKVFIIYIGASSSGEGVVVKDLEKVDFNGIQCLCGKSEASRDWYAGKKLYIPIDRINLIIEFDSAKDYESILKKHTGEKTNIFQKFDMPEL